MVDKKISELTLKSVPESGDEFALIDNEIATPETKKTTYGNIQDNLTLTASQVSDFDTEVSNNTDVTDNTTHRSSDGKDHSDVVINNAKETNVTTNLSLGTITSTTMDVNSSDGTNATLIEANTTNAGILGSDKWDEIVASTTHITSDGTDHTFINQDIQTTASPTFTNASSSNNATANAHLVRLDQMNEAISGIHWQDAIEDQVNFVTSEPSSPSTGDRYINTTTGTSSETAQSVTANYIYEWNGTTWDETVAIEGMAVWDKTADTNYTFNGTSWVEFGSTVSHNNTSGLQGGTTNEYYHLTNSDHTNLTDSGDTSLHFHSVDRARANHTGTQTASTISDFDTSVNNRKLSVFNSTTSSELAGVISDETGSSSLVFANTPTLVTPEIGAATGTSLDLGGTTLLASRSLTVDTGGVFDINLGTASGDDFTIDSSSFVVEGDTGNVGIGTSTPTGRLTVSADDLAPTVFTSSAAGAIVHSFSSSATASTTNQMSLDLKALTSTSLRIATRITTNFEDITDGTRTSKLRFLTNDNGSFSTAMTILGFNVGIGTTEPTAPLHVKSAGTNTVISRFESSTGDEMFEIVETSGGDSVIRQRNILNTITNLFNTDGNSYFNGGNLGIGTTSPTTKLDIDSDANSLPATSGTTQTGNILRLNGAGSTTLDIGSDASAGKIWLQSVDNTNLATERILLLNPNGGNVGIGTDSPTAKLHVDQSSTTGAIPVITLDQADISEEMIKFETTIGTGNPIEAVAAKTLTTTHFIKVTLPGGLTRYIPAGTIA